MRPLPSAIAVLAATLSPAMAHSQALTTATQLLELSVFGGATGSLAGVPNAYSPSLPQAKNLGITAGVNLATLYFHRFQPSVEIRGTYPIHDGDIAAEENILGGIKIERHFGRIRAYGDFFYGRGRINYQSGGYPSLNGQFIYVYTNSAVLSPGGGVDLDLTPHFALKADFQYQRYATPVVASGAVYGKAATAGIIYRFDFNHHLKYMNTSLPKNGRTTPSPAARPAPAAPAPQTMP